MNGGVELESEQLIHLNKNNYHFEPDFQTNDDPIDHPNCKICFQQFGISL